MEVDIAPGFNLVPFRSDEREFDSTVAAIAFLLF